MERKMMMSTIVPTRQNEVLISRLQVPNHQNKSPRQYHPSLQISLVHHLIVSAINYKHHLVKTPLPHEKQSELRKHTNRLFLLHNALLHCRRSRLAMIRKQGLKNLLWMRCLLRYGNGMDFFSAYFCPRSILFSTRCRDLF